MYPDEFPDFVTTELVYVVLGLSGETGEVVEKLKKAIREDDEYYLEDMEKELGDILWYWARVCEELSASSGDLAQDNLDKLLDRAERDVLTGEGDNR